MSKNRVVINIAGSSYRVLSEESAEYVRLVSEEVDARITRAKKSSSDISSLMAAILTAMDFCDLYRKSVKNKAELESQNRSIRDINESLRMENNILRAKIGKLEMKLSALTTKKNGKN